LKNQKELLNPDSSIPMKNSCNRSRVQRFARHKNGG